MHIIAIGWLWVAFMMSITQPSILAGVSTFVFYGLLPCALLLYLLGAPLRRRRIAQRGTEAVIPTIPLAPAVSPQVKPASGSPPAPTDH